MKGMVDQTVSFRDKQEAEPLTLRKGDRCGTCGGFLAFDDDLEGDKCRSCGRLAGPALPPTPEEVRATVLSELADLAAEIIPPEQFWSTYVSLDDLAQVVGMQKKNFREWLRYNGYLPERRRNPKSGKWADFLLIDTAKAAIKHRIG